MSTKNHLKRIVNRLRECFDHEIQDSYEWSWNLKNYTLMFTNDDDYQSVVAYKVKDNITQWNDYITLERRTRQWIEEVV